MGSYARAPKKRCILFQKSNHRHTAAGQIFGAPCRIASPPCKICLRKPAYCRLPFCGGSNCFFAGSNPGSLISKIKPSAYRRRPDFWRALQDCFATLQNLLTQTGILPSAFLRRFELLFRRFKSWVAYFKNQTIGIPPPARFLARPAGFEPATCGLEIRCSIQLG